MVRRIRPARHYQHPRAPIRALADGAIRPMAQAFKTSLKVARKLFDGDKAAYLLANGRWREVASLIDWKHADEALRRPLGLVGDVWLAAGYVGERKINGAFAARRRPVRYGIRKDHADQFSFDQFNPTTQAKIRDLQDMLISELGQGSRQTIEQVILNALRMGKRPEDIVREIRAVIGLTARQAQSVINYRNQLLELEPNAMRRALVSAADRSAVATAISGGTALSASEIDQLVASYEDAYLTHRAITIATTEATRASSMGLQDSYQQAVERGVLPNEAVRVVWQISLDEKTCFPAGTLVSAVNGNIAIERLVPGQRVLTRSGYRRVLATSSKAYSQTVVLIICRNGQAIASTLDHPVWAGGRWAEAREVKPGDVLYARNDQAVQVVAVTHFEFSEPHCAPSLSNEPVVTQGVFSSVMPINAIDLYSHLVGHQGKVDEISADTVLLVKFDAPSERLADGRFYRCFALEPTVAAARAKRSVGLAGTAMQLATAPAWQHVDWATAGLGAVLAAAIAGLHKFLAAPLAIDMADYGEPAFAGANFVAVGSGSRDAEDTAATGAELFDAPVQFVHDILRYGWARVYDIEVQQAHEFFANGLLVHNCDHCLSVIDMNPDGVALGDPFQSDEGPVDGPGLHPNCRCSVEIVTNLDLVPEDYQG